MATSNRRNPGGGALGVDARAAAKPLATPLYIVGLLGLLVLAAPSELLRAETRVAQPDDGEFVRDASAYLSNISPEHAHWAYEPIVRPQVPGRSSIGLHHHTDRPIHSPPAERSGIGAVSAGGPRALAAAGFRSC